MPQLSVDFTDDDIQLLNQLTEDKEVTTTEALRSAIATQVYLQHLTKNDNVRIFCHDKSGDSFELSFE